MTIPLDDEDVAYDELVVASLADDSSDEAPIDDSHLIKVDWIPGVGFVDKSKK